MKNMVNQEILERKIYLIRAHKVMLDKDLAKLYGIGTRDLNKAVTRNMDRFPEDFMFRLSKEEAQELMFQYGTSTWGGTRKLPRVFTEQGVAMLSTVLRSKRAIYVNIAIMRAFVRFKQIFAINKDLSHKLNELEKKVEKHDSEIQAIFDAIRDLIAPTLEGVKRKIGFGAEE